MMMTKYSDLAKTLKRSGIACLAAALILTGCDSSTGTDVEGDVTFEGRVTDEAGFGKTSTAANVEGAVVTAANVTADGSIEALDGEATTDAEGEFVLDVEGAFSEVILTAETDDFTSKTLTYHRSSSRVETMPMTAETHAEADVFLEAREEAGEDLTMADAAFYVTEDVAADVRDGTRSAAEVGAAIAAGVQATMAYVREQEDDDAADDVIEGKNDAFLFLQADLAAAEDVDDEIEALESFELALLNAFVDADISLAAQARAHQIGLSAAVGIGEADTGVRKQAEILTSLATAFAIEASFDAADASEERLDTLANARMDLIEALRAASDLDDIEDAKAEYEAAIQAELAAELEVDESVLVDALGSTAIETARTALETALTAATSPEVYAEAYAAFFGAVETGLQEVLEEEDLDRASFAVEVLTLLSID